MFLNTFVCSAFYLVSLIAAADGERSPKYLFTSESDISSEGTIVLSQYDTESRDSLRSERKRRHTRSRRFSPPVNPVPAPSIKPSQGFCNHDELVIRWTEAEVLTSKGAIVALCRNSKSSRRTQMAPQVFVSDDHGSSWSNVTEKFVTALGSGTPWVEDYYAVQTKPNFIIFTDKKNQRIFYTNDGLKTVVAVSVPFKPDKISINPGNTLWVIAADFTDDPTKKKKNRIYLSKDGSKSYNIIRHFDEVNQYYWGREIFGDKPTDIFVEGKRGGSSKTQGYKLDCTGSSGCNRKPLTDSAPLSGDIIDFLVKGPYMFCTKENAAKNALELYVKYTRNGTFKKANIMTDSPLKEVFVYDVTGDVVMLVVNHRKNETNLYTSLDSTGTNYSLSLPRVLYHNPNTEVSSHWLRRAVSFRFVDILGVKGLPSVYFATQLTVGPVGGRYLISMMTFDKGGKWQRIRGPRRNKYGQICLYPGCALHVNLFYGSIYRYSRTTPLMSRRSAPGLIMTTGVLGSNLKITPDTYLSRDGGQSFDLVLRGKKRFAFGDHGGIVVASEFSRARTLLYSVDFKHFSRTSLSASPVNVKKIMTEPGGSGPVFLVMGVVSGTWKLFQVNATRTLGRPCTKADYMLVNVSETGLGGCLVKQVEVRNSSIRCISGRNYSRVTQVSYENCFCRRLNYICDPRFKPDFYGDCRPRSSAELIPSNCPEATFYEKSQGYNRIQGHNCKVDNFSRELYEPKKTPCPAQRLVRLDVTSSPKAGKDGLVIVVLGSKVTLDANVGTGYLPHISFTWNISGVIRKQGVGKDYATFSFRMDNLGNVMISVLASNPVSNMQRFVLIVVQRKLDQSKLNLTYMPNLPSVKEEIRFVVDIHDVNLLELGPLKFSWKLEDFHPNAREILKTTSTAPFLLHTFNVTGQKKVTVLVHNGVSHALTSVFLDVTKDLKVKNVRVSPTGASNLLVQWDDIGEPAYLVLRYRVQYRKIKDLVFTEAPGCVKGALECIIVNVSAFTTYQVFVDVVTKDGYGPRSDIVTRKTPPAPPSVPTNVRLSIEGAVKVEASWQKPKYVNGILTGYKYKFYKRGKSAKEVLIDDPANTTQVFDKLSDDDDYLFEVAAVNQLYTGPYSEATVVRTGVDKPTEPPTRIIVIYRNTTTVKLTWTPPKIRNDSKALFSPRGYKVYMIKKGKPEFVGSTSDPEYTFTGLQSYTSYTVAIAAYVTAGDIGPRATMKFTTLLGPPSPPTDFKVTSKTSTSASFSWTPQGNVRLISKYEVYQLSPATLNGPSVIHKPKATVRDLEPYTSYVFAVRAFHSDTPSTYSDNVTVTTSEEKPSSPEYLIVQQLWPPSSSVALLWGAPLKPNGVIKKYEITWYPVSSNRHMKKTSQNLSVEINHLKQHTKYQFNVKAFTKIGAGPMVWRVFTTSNYPPGSQPLTLTFANVGDAAMLAKKEDFGEKFPDRITDVAGIPEKRIADVRLNATDNTVEFELISSESLQGKEISVILDEMEEVKRHLMRSFAVENARIKPKSLKAGTPRTGGQTGKKGSSSNMRIVIGVVSACVVIIILLMAALVVLYRKYHQKGVYNKFDNQFQYNHDDDAVQSIHSDTSGEVEVRLPSHKHRNKDIETVPLADADELT